MRYLFDCKQYKKFCGKKFKCCQKCHKKSNPNYPPFHYYSFNNYDVKSKDEAELYVCCNAPKPTTKDWHVLLSKIEEGRLTSNTDPYDD